VKSAPAPALFTRYGLSRTGDRAAPLVLEPYPEICRRGALRIAVIAAAVDIAGSLFAREIAGSDPTFTSDLSVRAPLRPAPGRVLVRASLLGATRSEIAAAVALEADGARWAYGEVRFRRVARRAGDSASERLSAMPAVIPRVPLERALADEVGAEICDPARGRVEIPLRDALRNPEGVLQGALVALLAELSAESLAEHALGGGRSVSELDLRYLAPNRVGPIAAEADWVGQPSEGMLRVQLCDLGRESRITATALLRTGASPEPKVQSRAALR